MDGYLVDTNMLSALLDPSHEHHLIVRQALERIGEQSPRYVSVIALAEIVFGRDLAVGAGKATPRLDEMVRAAKSHALLDVTRHTASEYATLKALLAHHYLHSALGKKRPRWLEDWVDRTTGKQLQVDENDLWMCAQARERNLVFMTTDRKMRRIADADALLRLDIIT